MLPNHFVVLWDERPVGVDQHSGGYPYKTNIASEVRYFREREEAQKYVDTLQRSGSDQYIYMKVVEIQFRIMDAR
jgi:hypothetical protein